MSGSPPCSPQMPIFRSGRVLRPFSTAIFISWPTPSWSIVGERVRLDDLVLLVVRQERAVVVAAHAEAGLRQVVGAEAEELGASARSRRPSARRAGARSSCRPGS